MHATYTLAVAALASTLPSALGLIAPRAATALSQAQIDALTPYTFLAAAAYCSPASTLNWSCTACRGNADIQPTASGGDGASVQFWYVGYSPSLSSVVVGHQGTDFDEIEAVISDANIIRDPLNSTTFPGIPSGVKAHGGFLDAHERAAPAVLAAVRTTIARTGAKKISIASHSLGAALGLLDAVMFKQQLPGIAIKFVGYGMPRVGNQDFANWVDANLSDVTRVANQQDIVPILPGRFLGFRHPSGEIHIAENGKFMKCNGQESEEDGCTIDETPNIFVGEPADHSGPYGKVTKIGCGQGPV
jgi:hypothetical protein